MIKRSDGQATQERIVRAAQQVWADHGFRDATIAMIAKEASCNSAAINYYFGSKEELYALVWRRSFAAAIEHYPVDGGIPVTAPAKERLHGFIHTRLRFLLEGSEQSLAGRLLLRDLGQPNPAIDQVRFKALSRIRQYILHLIREIVGPDLPQHKLAFCVQSLVHQILMYGLRHHRLPVTDKEEWSADRIALLADHITTFSLAGLQAIVEDDHV